MRSPQVPDTFAMTPEDMFIQYHKSITRKALKGYFSPGALNEIVAGNLTLDNLRGLFGHDEYHFDNNALEKSYAYIEEQRALVYDSLRKGAPPAARAAFGRLIHTAQDFYANSNYVDLWLAQFSRREAVNGNPPPPEEIDPLVEELIHSPDLHSGKLYYPLELLAFVPLVRKFVIPLLPRDSHAHMNLDSPKRGFRFAYTFEAAVKRTVSELELTSANLAGDTLRSFYGHPGA
jgi:hypothetical protein